MDAKVTKDLPHVGNGATVDPGSRAARLGDLSRRIPPPRIADVWLFPPLPQVEDSSEFFLFTSILDDGGRALYSARMAPANGTPSHQVVVEHGRAPANRVPGLVAGLQKRLGQPAAVRHIPIEGDGARWEALVEQSQEATGSVDPDGQDR
ncbi:hypothetical protein [Candidatus Palauibacter sp.]|uniref:hypothetical protein n=1 Tax=Candidatus Palauibacter sp. TaxID=3101350 RepID=UPI003B51E014